MALKNIIYLEKGFKEYEICNGCLSGRNNPIHYFTTVMPLSKQVSFPLQMKSTRAGRNLITFPELSTVQETPKNKIVQICKSHGISAVCASNLPRFFRESTTR